MELRAIKSDEMRANGEEDPVVEGYGILYDSEIELFPKFFEKIGRGAFTKSLNKREVIKSYFNHDSDKVLSTTGSDPALTLREDERGVFFSSPIPPTSYGNDLKINLKRKNVAGSSFAFTVDKQDWEERKEDGSIHRTILEGTIYEIGPVTDPAYVQTGATLKSTKDEFEKRQREFRAAITTTTATPTDNNDNQRNENILKLEMLKLNLEKETLQCLLI